MSSSLGSSSSISSPVASPAASPVVSPFGESLVGDLGPSLFDACRNGDLDRVRALVSTPDRVNARDLLGRKSTPLHFAAGKQLA